MTEAIVTGVIGIVLLAAGIAMRIFVSRRRFYRRNVAGLEEFRNYSSSVVVSAGERLLSIVGCALAIIGFLMAAGGTINVITH